MPEVAHILVVYDDDVVLAFVTRLLKLHGHEADTAADGGQAHGPSDVVDAEFVDVDDSKKPN